MSDKSVKSPICSWSDEFFYHEILIVYLEGRICLIFNLHSVWSFKKLWVVECDSAVLNMSVCCGICLWSIDCFSEVLIVSVKCWMCLGIFRCVSEVLNVPMKGWMHLWSVEFVSGIQIITIKSWMCPGSVECVL